MSSPKRQKSSKDVPYELIYWPSIPGRGEHIRLALEEAGATYTDTAHIENGIQSVMAQIDAKNTGDDENPPPLAPPILKHGDLVISQTSNILLYLGPRLNLVPPTADDADGLYKVNQLALTALDGLSNEPHDCHHPVATGLYYEDQKEESLRKSKDFVKNRLPKFLGYFERVLQGKASGEGPWLYNGKLSYADLVLFQVSFIMSLPQVPVLNRTSVSMESNLPSPRPWRRPRRVESMTRCSNCMMLSKAGHASRNT